MPVLEANLDYDYRTPRTAHEMLAADQFREFFGETLGPILNVAAGRTDLQRNLLVHGIVRDVTSLDPMYGHHPGGPRHGRVVTGVAQELPFADDEFSLTLMHYGLQHIRKRDTAVKSVAELIRVTQRVADVKDWEKGTVIVGPVFDVRTLWTVLKDKGYDSYAGIDNPSVKQMDRRLPALILKKTAQLDYRAEEFATDVVASGAMYSRRTLPERMSRLAGGMSTK